jgi:hypothetical protein
VAILLLVLVISLGNFVLGFGLATQLGFGPDWSWLKAKPTNTDQSTAEKHA